MMENFVAASIQTLTDVEGPTAGKREATINVVASIIAFFISLLLVALIGKLLWNNVIVDLFSFARPVRSVWHMVGLAIFMALFK
jgi:hypothetical protein